MDIIKENNYNSTFIQDLLDNPKNKEQALVVAKWPKMVNRILSEIEKGMQDGKQCRQLKKSLNGVIYQTRNNLLTYFHNNSNDTIDAFVSFVNKEFDFMFENIDRNLEVSLLKNPRHYQLVLGFVEDVVLDVREDFINILNSM